jgi:hypothetical protein
MQIDLVGLPKEYSLQLKSYILVLWRTQKAQYLQFNFGTVFLGQRFEMIVVSRVSGGKCEGLREGLESWIVIRMFLVRCAYVQVYVQPFGRRVHRQIRPIPIVLVVNPDNIEIFFAQYGGGGLTGHNSEMHETGRQVKRHFLSAFIMLLGADFDVASIFTGMVRPIVCIDYEIMGFKDSWHGHFFLALANC